MEDNPLLEYDIWKEKYKFPSKSIEPTDMQICAIIIYELHKIKEGDHITEDALSDAITTQYNISDEKIKYALYTLHAQCIISMSTKIYQNEPAYHIREFSFNIHKVNEEFNIPWHRS